MPFHLSCHCSKAILHHHYDANGVICRLVHISLMIRPSSITVNVSELTADVIVHQLEHQLIFYDFLR